MKDSVANENKKRLVTHVRSYADLINLSFSIALFFV